MAKTKLPSFEYTRAVYEDGTFSDWVNLAKPKYAMRWQAENPDTPLPETIEDNVRFLYQALGVTEDFDAWAERIEGLESREFESGKANA